MGTQKKILCLFLPLVLCPFLYAAAQTDSDTTKVLHAYRIEEDFEITGSLSNPLWERAEAGYIEYEISPDDDDPAPVKTEVRVLYSDNSIYFGFIAHDPKPSEIRESITERDHISGDYLGVFLDTYGNRQQAYEFLVNPLGIQFDAFRTPNNEDSSFDALWYSAGAINDSGYTVVIKVPFKSLNFPEKRVQDWTVQFFRNYPRNLRHQLLWTNVDREDACLLCENGYLANIRGIESENTIEILPYVAGFQSSELNESGNPESGLNHGPVKIRAGGSISYAPTSTMSLNAVINPDFSQVESDAAQISINESFALFYPEKRPFFLKGASLFATNENLYYSRTINNPIAAGKFTQKTGDYSIAFLSAYDQNTPFVVPGLDESAVIDSDINSYSNILRGKYNFGPETYVGGLITTRNLGEGYNYVGSIDWQVRLGHNYYVDGQLAYSYTHELSDTTLFNDFRSFGNSSYDAAFNGEKYGGRLVNIEVDRRAKYYSFELGYKSYSPTFQTQNGFINRINHREFFLSQNLSYYPNKKWFPDGDIFSVAGWKYDFSGQLQERFIIVGTGNQFIGQTELGIEYLLLNDERYRGQFFTGVRRWTFGLESQPLEEISFGAEITFGKFIYRADNPTVGEGYNFSVEADLQPINRLQLEFSYSYSTLSSLNGSAEFFSGNILRITGRFHFSRELFFRLITQYNSFSEQIQIYPLVYYQLNPFTKFYIGMTDYLQQSGPADGLNQYRQVNRQFFVKFQYLFRY